MSEERAPSATLSLRDLRRVSVTRLKGAGVDTPDLDARLLIQHALGLPRDHFLTRADQPVPPEGIEGVLALIERRARREPVSRILGHREFWSLDFALGPATLDPRPDTETVVETVLDTIADRQAPLSVLDLGTGTGCILLALLSELANAVGVGIDISPEAAAVAGDNAARLGLADRARFVIGDFGADLARLLAGRRFDVVVSNPPYIPNPDIATLDPEVKRFDPWAALAGGHDGLDAYRALAPQVAEVLNAGALVVFEVGAGQASTVASLLSAAGLIPAGTKRDLTGIERVVVARTEG